jgi:membrane AbrB-like protein
VGVVLGSRVALAALAGVASDWWLVVAAVGLTLALSVAVARTLARASGLDRLTATIGLLPGAAPALVAVGDELGADARLVATIQYGRVLLVVASVPVLALIVGSGAEGGGIPGGGFGTGGGADGSAGLETTLAAAAVAVVGVAVAALARLPAASLVGPLALAALVTATGLLDVGVPGAIADAAFVGIGASVGLLYDRASLRRAGRLLPAIVGAVLALTAACAVPGAMLALGTGTDALTAYLATTPGGISSVFAAAFDSGADLTLVIAVQTLRLLVLALVAPFAARLLRVSRADVAHGYPL